MRLREQRALDEVEVHHVEVALVHADDLARTVMAFARDDAVHHHFAARGAHGGNYDG